MGILNRIAKNRKAQFEIVALVLLVTGVTVLSSSAILGISSGVRQRADFARAFISMNDDLDGMEVFYGDAIETATIKTLERNGHNMNSFCALGVNADEKFKGAVINIFEQFIAEQGIYKSYELPHLRAVDGTIGDLHFEAVEGSAIDVPSYLQIQAKPLEKVSAKTKYEEVKIDSASVFTRKIYSTAAGRPDLVVASLKILDNNGNEITSIKAEKKVTIETKIVNLECATVKAPPIVTIYVGSEKIFEGDTTYEMKYRGEKIFQQDYTPANKGEIIITVKVDENNAIVETNELNNERSTALTVS